MGTTDSHVSFPTTVKFINSKPLREKSKRLPKTHLHTNAWRLVDYEFDALNALFSFIVEAYCDPDGTNRHGFLPF